ncbi:LacI family DNA-binding transcriptional regulator [Listeria grandensis]|uniref:LacI family DNA-binding transcriptional regulator n=1 Tax=Listeria grandensis TaxID=1494963 RepID=UPI00164D15EE|nr:LacI family DNA-binding transcriptional regulator [Listeria grandensis]MBC6314193.1 LacI family transcriptional regulator [Listeria grandensis]
MKKKSITIDDVAKKAGVSKSTVSQYLNKRYEYMSQSTRENIEQIIHELNFHPNESARNLKNKKTTIVGIVVANIRHAFSTEMIRIIENALEAQDIYVIICNADDNPQKEEHHIRALLSRKVDGLIIFPTETNATIYRQILKEEIPVVFIDRIVDGLSVDTILLDNQMAASLAVSTLAASGHNKIAMLTLPTRSAISPRIERIEGYKTALTACKIPFNPDYIYSDELHTLQAGLTKIFQLADRPNALIAGNDLILREILHFLKVQKLTIPSDVAVIGIDDVSYADIYQPSLTTIAQPTEKMGLKVAEIILNRLQNKEKKDPELYRFAPELKKRDSS